MGMYDRDPNFEDTFSKGDRMVLMGLEYQGQINTSFGQADKTIIHVVTRDSYPTILKFSALGAGFANLAKRATQADFPHVAEFIHVPLPGNKHVKRFAAVTFGGSPLSPKEWVDGNDGDPVDLSQFETTTGGGNAAAGKAGF